MPWGSDGAAARWCSYGRRAASARADRRYRHSSPVASQMHTRSAISEPWSQVTERRSCWDNWSILFISAAATVPAVWTDGRQVQHDHEPVLPLTRGPIADPNRLDPRTRSCSQSPGTARPSTSAGRWEMLTMSGTCPRRSSGRRCGLHRLRPVRRYRVSSRHSRGLPTQLPGDPSGPGPGRAQRHEIPACGHVKRAWSGSGNRLCHRTHPR